MIRLACVLIGLCLSTGAAGQTAYPGIPQPLSPADCKTEPETWSQRALERSLTPQLGLPPVPHPPDNPPTRAKIELGRKLFFDRRLSINRTMSCAMCHVPEQGFANWELSTSVGVEGRSLKRNAPTVVNVGYLSTLFHDGRDFSLETQFVAPMVARNEMANPSVGHVVALLRQLPDYPPLFNKAFAAPASLDRIGQALAVYQRSLNAGNSPFDRWYFAGEDTAISDVAKRGFTLFTTKAGCQSCHTINADYALFTDHSFHDTGYGRIREADRQTPSATVPVQVAPGVIHHMDVSRVQAVSRPREADLGRYEVTEKPIDRWKFRTPSLRNLSLTPPYMHDGHLGSLRDVIAFYNRGGANHADQDPRIRPLGLSEQEQAELEAFLMTLTSDALTCLAGEARISPPDNH